MKEKTKKILAGIGIGAVLGSSGLIMTGCGMTDEQQKALDIVVNKADEIIELVDSQNKELSYSEAIRLFEYAKMRLTTNKDSVWDNLSIHYVQDLNENYGREEYSADITYHLYKFDDGKRVAYTYIKEDGDNIHFDTGAVYTKEVIEEKSSDTNNTPGQPGSLTQLVTFTGLSQYISTNLLEAVIVSDEDIVACEINEKGNYCITASLMLEDGEGTWPALIDMEITPDGYIMSYKINCFMSIADTSYGKAIVTRYTTYDYGVLNDDIVQANINKYKTQEGL